MIRNFRPAAGFLIDDENENRNDNANKTNSASTLYRCGSTDILGQQNKYNTDAHGDQIVFHHAGLILDLRSPNERNEEDSQRWMENASASVSGTAAAAAVPSSAARFDSKRITTSTIKKPRSQPRPIYILKVPTTIDSTIEEEWFEMNFATEDEDDKNNNNSLSSRYVIQLDILNRFELVQYIQTNWLLPKTSVSINDHNSDPSIANSITAELNKRGLAGLNEVIVETKTGQTGLCRALQIMTLYREAVIRSTKKRNIIKRNHDSTHHQQQQQRNDDDDSSDATINDSSSIVIHCVQGKDRTGMLIMLMQLLIGLSDAEIIDDYYRSNDSLVDYHAGRKKQQQQQQQRQTKKEGRRNVIKVDTTQDKASAAAAAIIAVGTSTTTTTKVAPPRIKMETRIFGGTNKAAMISTLEGLRHRYSSSSTTTTNDHADDDDASTTSNASTRSSSSSRIPIHYFDSIGFHESWRTRFRNVFKIKKNDTSIVRQRSRL